jgi:hypothetical protein
MEKVRSMAILGRVGGPFFMSSARPNFIKMRSFAARHNSFVDSFQDDLFV